MFHAFTRPRYQVSVYRTIGPLVQLPHSKYFRNIYQYSLCVNRTLVGLPFNKKMLIVTIDGKMG